MRFRAEQHLRRQRDFRMAREQGRRIECGGFTLWYVKRSTEAPSSPSLSAEVVTQPADTSCTSTPAPAGNGSELPAHTGEIFSGESARNVSTADAGVIGPRVGVVASTAAVGGAVQRNRAKRRLREVFRHHQNEVPAQLDLLLIARRSLNQLAYVEIEKKFVEACARLSRKPEVRP